MYRLALTSTTGNIGGAVLSSILAHSLVPATSLVICTSSDPSSTAFDTHRALGITIRQLSYTSAPSLRAAFADCYALFVVSSPSVSNDFAWVRGSPAAPGREATHVLALDAARDAGVRRVVYTSLAFTDGSRSLVMRAHLRTEEHIKATWPAGAWTVLREGLYSESWPLYLGHWDIDKDLAGREEAVVGGDGKLSWTAIADLGLATAVVLAAEGEEAQKFAGKIVVLAQRQSWTLAETAEMVGRARGREVAVRVVDREEHERYYIKERGMDEAFVKWWARTYDALPTGECEQADGTLEEILERYGRKPKQMEETVREMVQRANEKKDT